MVGELFGASGKTESSETQVQQLLNGQIEVPLPTYFALGKNLLPDAVVEKLRANSGELCTNLYFLGRQTTIKTSEGVKIVALGGTYEGEVLAEKTSLNEFSPVYTYEDVKILKGANNADILLTADWPTDVRMGSRAAHDDTAVPQAQTGVAELCSWLKPRYHFSTSTAFFEREPFFHPQEEGSEGYQITRFLSLAPYGNTSKQKWIYAFSIDAKAAPPVAIPAGTTASPYTFTGKKRKATTADSTPSYSRYSNGDSHARRGKKARMPPPTPQQCFFCLSNPNIATHLITSIADNAYLTTAKGPLSTGKTFSGLGFPGHTLIIPLEHSPTIFAIQDKESRSATEAEMQRYQRALQKMVSTRSAQSADKDKLGAVTWEISRAGGIHMHWQFMPIPADLITKGLVEAAFKVEAENRQYPSLHIDKPPPDRTGEDGEELDGGAGDYFKATLWTEGGKEKVLMLYLDSSFRFDLQVGRIVLAKLLGLENRIDWRDCGQSEADETADAEAFKEAFKDFDFALDA